MTDSIPMPGSIAPAAKRDRRRDRAMIRTWLGVVILMIVAMIVVGGATRLTNSGLSITEWKPIHGVVPPLNAAEWQEEFDKYRQIPQYQQINKGMSLDAFKSIFWWEWAHRLLGRLIGAVFFVPLVFFWVTGRIEKNLVPPLIGLFVLGGLQGAVGWWMVASGLVNRVDVSQYRLATHLTLACFILAATVWVRRGLGADDGDARDRVAPLKGMATFLIVLVFVQIFLGGLVAGLDAGFTYNTWPLMDGALIPSRVYEYEPVWRSVFEDVMTVQFDHRMVAYLLLVAAFIHAFQAFRVAPGSRAARRARFLALLVIAQAGIGVMTLLMVVPIDLALTHQFGAAVVLIAAVAHRRALAAPIPITD